VTLSSCHLVADSFLFCICLHMVVSGTAVGWSGRWQRAAGNWCHTANTV